MPSTALTSTSIFQELLAHHDKIKKQHMRDLFSMDSARFQHFSVKTADILLDYSKNRINYRTLKLLFALARECNVETQRDAMFHGENINYTEHRAALHTALRDINNKIIKQNSQFVNQDISVTLNRMHDFVKRVRAGTWRGYTGKLITDIVNIGIGGSHLGPKMVCAALRSYIDKRFNIHFVSNVDSNNLNTVLEKIKPESTLFIIASKTFKTQETILNAQSARNWFLKKANYNDMYRHFIAISTQTKHVCKFGIDANNIFPIWDWVGGRYSLWSSIGLSIALAIGFKNFRNLLAGAHAMDLHFYKTPLEKNMPVILALIGIWNRNFFNIESLVISPYYYDLRYFPAYLQQLEMESNGKCINCDGKLVNFKTCPFVWGDVGTDGQHAFFQMLHQGTSITAIDFIAILNPTHHFIDHHTTLLANCFAQSEALMCGKLIKDVQQDCLKHNINQTTMQITTPHKICHGNKPSNTILLDTLTPSTLGALIALYEHKTFVQGIIWNINSFDQWGVELGKILANQIQLELKNETKQQLHDSSTLGLINLAKTALTKYY